MDLYNIDISCNYREYSDEIQSDLVYKKNLIQIFNLDDDLSNDDLSNDDLFKKMRITIEKIRDYLIKNKKYDRIQVLAKKASKQFIIEDEIIGFMVLFSYDFFDLFHELLVLTIKNIELNLDISDKNLFDTLHNKI
jgi:hypothetical protein